VATPDPKQRISVINALRAFAALAVAWGHFVAGQGKWLGLSGKYGYLGVDIFFVISGFVIPWSMYRSRYVLRDYGRFMLKRNLRLYPPYLASIAISILATNFILVPLFKIPHMTVTGRDLLLHFTYLNDLFKVKWVNVVYWTLAIEFQWYLLVGLVMPLLASRKSWPRFVSVTAMVLAYWILPSLPVPYDRLVIYYLPTFLIGVFVFQYRAEIISRYEFFGMVTAMVGAMYRNSGWLVPVVAVPTALLIAFSRFHSRRMDRVGDISYSLYLLHLPIGVSIIGMMSHWIPYSSYFIGVLDVIGIAASCWAAWIMYQYIERPSQEMSSAIRYTRRSAPAPQPVVAAAAD
jgi:peptidoglycan/LPS O-acetylase OafA/YrhL